MAKTKPIASEMTDPANWREVPVATGLVGIVPFAAVAALKSRGILTMGLLAVALDDAADIGLGVLAEKVRGHLQALKRPATRPDMDSHTNPIIEAPHTLMNAEATNENPDHDRQTFEIPSDGATPEWKPIPEVNGHIISSEDSTPLPPPPSNAKPKSPADRVLDFLRERPGVSLLEIDRGRWVVARMTQRDGYPLRIEQVLLTASDLTKWVKRAASYIGDVVFNEGRLIGSNEAFEATWPKSEQS